MRDTDCIAFLQWALPQMGLRWPGFRRVRGQVCKRISRRVRQLHLDDLEDYRRHLLNDPKEWRLLDSFCCITISRFFRDRIVYRLLGERILPDLAADLASGRGDGLRAWSAGCGAGEEPYTLSILHRHTGDPGLKRTRMEIVATDVDEHQLERGRAAVYPCSCLRDVPRELECEAFERLDSGLLRLRRLYREEVAFMRQDLRRVMPDGPFHLVLCRNLAFTYFVEGIQRRVLTELAGRLAEGGYLVIGAHERLPEDTVGFASYPGTTAVLQKGSHRVGGRPSSAATPGLPKAD